MTILGHERVISHLTGLAGARALPHGYIFFGPEGVGKQTVALALASYFEKGVFEPSQPLSDCMVVAPGASGTLGIEAVREVRRMVWQTPLAAPYRTVIVNDAHRMTDEAQHALLKAAEEPPVHALLILIVTDPQLLRETLRSRFQRLYFPVLPVQAVSRWLVETHSYAKKTAESLARFSFGRPGIALQLGTETQLRSQVETAQAWWEASPLKRRDMMKALAQGDDFVFTSFLDALLMVVAAARLEPSFSHSFWHKLLELRQRVSNFPLNPRIQMEAL
jgi:DNA polymerase-3 subunit delta'